MKSNLIKQQFIAYKNSWINSAKYGLSVDADLNFLPWYSYNGIEFVKNNLTQQQIIFEYGCGASTLFYTKRVARVISLETNRIWFDIITKKLIAKNTKFIISPNYFSIDNIEIFLLEDGLVNDEYQDFANNYALKNNIKFDFIIIDSLKRYQCALNAIKPLATNGYIILDDSQRPHYVKIIEFLQKNNFTEQVFSGIAPAQLRIKNTSFFKRG